MVDAGRVAMSWITVIICFLVILMVYTLFSPQIDMWGETLAHMLAGFSNIEYTTAITWVNMSWRVTGIVLEAGLIVWAILNSISDEYQSDFGGGLG